MFKVISSITNRCFGKKARAPLTGQEGSGGKKIELERMAEMEPRMSVVSPTSRFAHNEVDSRLLVKSSR